MRWLGLLFLVIPLAGFTTMASGADRKASFVIQSGTQFRDCHDCPLMVVIPAGTYQMGSQRGERGRSPDEGPVHPVTFKQPFAIGVYEITFAEWDACVSDGVCVHSPDDNREGRGDRPVINVNMADVGEFLQWLSAKTGHEYRLPSEAEWEYAARAGTETPRYWRPRQPACAFGNMYDVSGSRTHKFEWLSFDCIDAYGGTAPVGRFLANQFGLFDMLGNVWEWVADCWHETYVGAPDDGTVRQGGDCRRNVIRGGSWKNVAWATRSAFRGWTEANARATHLGFRVARFSQ